MIFCVVLYRKTQILYPITIQVKKKFPSSLPFLLYDGDLKCIKMRVLYYQTRRTNHLLTDFWKYLSSLLKLNIPFMQMGSEFLLHMMTVNWVYCAYTSDKMTDMANGTGLKQSNANINKFYLIKQTIIKRTNWYCETSTKSSFLSYCLLRKNKSIVQQILIPNYLPVFYVVKNTVL